MRIFHFVRQGSHPHICRTLLPELLRRVIILRPTRLFVPVFLVSLLTSLSSGAHGQRLLDLPKEERELGNDFVDAWQVLREKIDSLATTGGHPALLEKWLVSMPEFLVRDVATLATAPAVVHAAARRLMQIGGQRNLDLLRDLEAVHRSSPLGQSLLAIRMQSGDRELLDKWVKSMNSRWYRERVQAAILLAEAGFERGKTHLKEMVRKGAVGFELAIRTLGRICRQREDVFFEEQQRKHPNNRAVKAARGELAMRFHFPYHYQMLRRRNSVMFAESRASEMYDAWFVLVGESAEQGARTSVELLRTVEERQRALPSGEQGELEFRWLQSLVDFWRTVDKQVSLPSGPRWPRDLPSAKIAAGLGGLKPGAEEENPGGTLDDRISATIALLYSLGRAVGYGHLISHTSRVDILTPGGNRAGDGNLSTAWHGMTGAGLTLRGEGKGSPRRLWVMANCSGQRHRGIEAVEVESADGTWSNRPPWDAESRYFQKIELPPNSSNGLRIRILRTRGDLPGCLSEIRAD